MTALPKYRTPPQPQGRPVFVLNSGLTRHREGDWSVIHPDGTRQSWAGRAQDQGRGQA